MRRLLALLLLPCVSFAVVLGWSGSASSEEGTCSDPKDDTFLVDDPLTLGAGKLDIREMAHGNDEDFSANLLVTDDNFEAADVGEINWFIDTDGDTDEFEGRIWVRPDGDEFLGSIIKGVSDEVATATVFQLDNELAVFYERSALEEVGVEDAYDYVLETTEADEYRRDTTDPCTHDLAIEEPPPPTTTTVDLEDTTIEQGGELKGSAEGFEDESEAGVTVFSDPVVLGTVTASSSGVAAFTFTLPTSVTPGSHSVEVRGVNAAGGAHVAVADFTVVAAQVASPTPVPAPQSSALPSSGGPVERNALLGVFLLAIGLALMTATLLRDKPQVGLPSPNGVWIQPLPVAAMPVVSEPVEEVAGPPPPPRIGWAAPVKSWERRR